MTLKKAVEILHDYKMQSVFEATSDFEDALKLGIEAMKRLRNNRNTKPVINLSLLPGESKD